jgi:hypothetical protein
MTTISSYRQLASNLPAALSRTARIPEVKREADHYLSHIPKIKSIDAFMADDRVYRFAMKAFGLEDVSYAKALIRRVLSEGIDQPSSLANRLADPRYRDLVETFNFARYGGTATTFTRAQQGTVDRHVRQRLEVDAGKDNEGLRLALYFQRKAPTVTSAYGLLADRALLKVTQVALGLPPSSSSIDIERQKSMIESKLEITDLKTPERLDRLLTRFAALWDIETPGQGSASAAGLAPMGADGSIGLDLLTRIQALTRRR